MEYIQYRKNSVLKKGGHPVHVDAEYLCRTPIDFVAVPAALKVAI
jgi:diacylglycerol kinase family enzyme